MCQKCLDEESVTFVDLHSPAPQQPSPLDDAENTRSLFSNTDRSSGGTVVSEYETKIGDIQAELGALGLEQDVETLFLEMYAELLKTHKQASVLYRELLELFSNVEHLGLVFHENA
jgi:hypothetical protein